MASAFNLPAPSVEAPLTTNYQASMDPDHASSSDQIYRQMIRERLKNDFRVRDITHLFPPEQLAEEWNPQEGATRQRAVRSHDTAMFAMGIMRCYTS